MVFFFGGEEGFEMEVEELSPGGVVVVFGGPRTTDQLMMMRTNGVGGMAGVPGVPSGAMGFRVRREI